MVEKLDVFADLHAVFSRRHSNGDFPKCSRESRCYRFAAKALKGREPLLPEQNKRVAVHSGSSVNNVRTRQIRGDGRSAALIDVDGAGDNTLDRDSCSDLIDGHVQTALGKVTPFQGYEQWQTSGSRSRSTDLQTAFLRLGKGCRFGSCGNPRPGNQENHRPNKTAPLSSQRIFHRFLRALSPIIVLIERSDGAAVILLLGDHSLCGRVSYTPALRTYAILNLISNSFASTNSPTRGSLDIYLVVD